MFFQDLAIGSLLLDQSQAFVEIPDIVGMLWIIYGKAIVNFVFDQGVGNDLYPF
jgi:hypothetical protein